MIPEELALSSRLKTTTILTSALLGLSATGAIEQISPSSPVMYVALGYMGYGYYDMV